MKAGRQWAVERVLRTIGRDLGYGDSMALTGSDGGPPASEVKVTVTYIDERGGDEHAGNGIGKPVVRT